MSIHRKFVPSCDHRVGPAPYRSTIGQTARVVRRRAVTGAEVRVRRARPKDVGIGGRATDSGASANHYLQTAKVRPSEV
jgi:hypothetical protein